MRVLIADDDPSVSELLRQTVYSLGTADVELACDGNEALQLLARLPFDLLLLDWQMPGPSGLELIRTVRASGVRIPIILVTGVSDRPRILEAIQAGVSDIVLKPFDQTALVEKLERHWTGEGESAAAAEGGGSAARGSGSSVPAARSQRTGGNADSESAKASLMNVFNRVDEISTLPDLRMRLIQVANQPDTGLADLKQLLEKDVSLSARTLRSANSAAYAARKKVTSLPQALALLGLTEVRNLIVTSTISELFRGNGRFGSYDRKQLWRHMVCVGVCSRMIARKVGLEQHEEVFLAGLMHDIGIVLEDQFAHEQFCKVVRGLDSSRAFIEVEEQFLGFNHTILGDVVAAKWGFPQLVRSTIRHHHESMRYEGEDKLLVNCVELANAICSRRGICSVGADLVRPFDAEQAGLDLSEYELSELSAGLDEELSGHEALLRLAEST